MSAVQKLKNLVSAAEDVNGKIVANEAGLQINVPLRNFGDVKVIEAADLPESVKETINEKLNGCIDCG